MKSYIKAVMFGGLLAGMSSCTDLDTPITGQYTEFPNNPIATQSAFESCYHYTRNEAWFGRNFWEGVFLSNDEALGVQRAGSYDDGGRWWAASLRQFRPDLQGCGEMGDMESGISKANLMIQTYGSQELGGKDPVVAPLRAIRAYYTFWQMELYGDVPILEGLPKEGDPVERQPRADVAKWIEKELLEIIPDLTDENNINTYGRPNRWMAEALLVKLYLNWGVYTNPITTVTGSTYNEKLDDCIKWCDDIIQNGPFEVGVGYRKKFFPDNGVHTKDFIYAVDFDPERIGSGEWKYAGGTEMNRWWDYRLPGLCKPNTMGWTPLATTNLTGNFMLTPECVDRFNLPGDERNEMILVGPQYMFDEDFNKTDEPVIVYKTGLFLPFNKFGQLDYKKEFEWKDLSRLDVGVESVEVCMKGARLFKYPMRNSDNINWKGFQFNDIPIFRYADILLTKAECILRGGQATLGHTAASLMNEVRDCAHAPHVTGTPTLDELLDERSREFIMEPWRRNDLIRFGKFENCCKWKVEASPETMADPNKRLMPIPNGSMNTHTNWTQNPSYQ